MFLIVTNAGESSIVGQSKNLIFEIAGGKNISYTLTFTYYPDPEIEDVKPTQQLARCVLTAYTEIILSNN